jgi:hypothetical protein
MPYLDPTVSPFQGFKHNSIFSLADNFIFCPWAAADIYADSAFSIRFNNQMRLSGN